ncbi:MAG: carboxypeptidase regulatory-like domain-containing protein [Candidatus Wallbacteria bacterium]|nr:carboxypeptidase regulatory-like domain-containing protein [Candidatus Wallbacteria bacterium]
MRRFAVVAFAVVCGIVLGMGCGPDPDRFDLPATATVTGALLETTTTPPAPLGVAAARITLEVGSNAPKRGFLGPFFANAQGNYLVPNIPEGIYDLVADKQVGNPAQPLRGRVRFLNLRGGDNRVVADLILRPPGSMTGTVLLGGAGAAGNGGISVFLEGTTRVTSTDGSGVWTLADLEAGIYSVVFQKAGFVEETVHDVEVLSGQATQVSTTLEPLNPQSVAALAGRVVVEPRDAATGDHSGVRVTVEGTSRTLVTTPGGFFRFDSLPLALYALRLERTDTFTRRVPNIVLRTGEAVRDVGTIQLDTHRTLRAGLAAFDLEHAPNGTQVAFTSASGEIGVMDRNGNVFSQVLTRGAKAAFDSQTGLGRGLSWSPDGTEILFVRFEGFPTLPYRIGVVPSAGGAFRTLLTSGNEFYQPAWSPDGKAFNYYLTPNLRRVEVSRDVLGRTTAVTSTDRLISGSRPPGAVTVVSAIEAASTGRVVYSFATSATSNGVFSAFALGGVDPIDVLPTLPGGQALPGAESPTFSPAASRIAFSLKTNDAALRGIYLMNLDGSAATRLTTQPGNNLDFSPDGRRILFTFPEIGSSRLGEVMEVLVPR